MAGAATPEDAIRAFAEANRNADMATWRELVLDGFTYVHSASNKETKEEVIAAFENGRRYGGWEVEDLQTADFDGTAVVTGIGHLGVRSDPPRTLNVRFTATLLDRDGWRLAAFQTTRLPEE
jgi:hypothetical protein